MAGIRLRDKRLAKRLAMSAAMMKTVLYLFLVRNMFFSGM
jgi:hypothetical protein